MKASFKTIDLSGPKGLLMSGYYDRTEGNQGIHDPVYEKLVVIESNHQYFALGSGDYLGIDSSTLQEVREAVSSKTKIPFENIVLCATHTHSSYSGTNLNALTRRINKNPTLDDAEYQYHQDFVQKIIAGFIDAYETLETVSVGYGTQKVDGVGKNRNHPDGYFDNTVHVVRFNRPDGSMLGCLVEFPCHPTILNHENLFISSDYVGEMRDAIETLFPDSTCIFIQGAAGEVSTRFTRRSSSFDETKRLGYLLAASVLEVLVTVKDGEVLSIVSESPIVTLDRKKVKEPLELEALIDENKQKLKSLSTDFEIRKHTVIGQGLHYESLIRDHMELVNTEAVLQVVCFGPFNFVGIPGEAFGEMARDIIDVMGENTIVAGYTNGYLGYLVSNEALKEESYEKFMMVYDDNTHDLIVDKVIDTYHELQRKMS